MSHEAVSLFSGAGGLDVGFLKSGFDVIWANDIDRDSCQTYESNHGLIIQNGNLNSFLTDLKKYKGVDCIFGGPPCQGFSRAGSMDPFDPRNKLVVDFMKAVEIVRPSLFVMENVKPLAIHKKFSFLRKKLINKSSSLGYSTEILLLNAKDFGVPQARERMFLIGYLGRRVAGPLFEHMKKYNKKSRPLKDTFIKLGPAGNPKNKRVCRAKVVLAKKPVLRVSPYAGMLFNGLGRPLNPSGYASTLPATMGGNRTPIIDEGHFYDDKPSWVEKYHAHLMRGGKPRSNQTAPSRLRRLTINECAKLQTFPAGYKFKGSQSSVFRQIGNAVPCKLAERVAKLLMDILDGEIERDDTKKQMSL
jgi:DNA (cytosine-5)-methyltransferase 1